MSNADTRTAIAAALTGVDGITGYARRPRAPKTGDAWPLWRGSQRDGGVAFVETWAVVIALAGDEQAAEEFADARGEELEDALHPVLFVDTYAPAVVGTDAGDSNALMITGRTE